MNKQSLRNWAKEERKKLDNSKISKILVEKLVISKEYEQANNIMLFYPLKDEINLLDLLKDQNKNFYLPKIENNSLLCCSYKKGEQLCKSCFKTKEPLSQPSDKNIIDLIIVPALCCDKKNYRLGYGGGYYDKFLFDFKGKTVTCLPKDFIVETIYPESHDIKIDLVITC